MVSICFFVRHLQRVASWRVCLHLGDFWTELWKMVVRFYLIAGCEPVTVFLIGVKVQNLWWQVIIHIGSMYGIFTYISHHPLNVRR